MQHAAFNLHPDVTCKRVSIFRPLQSLSTIPCSNGSAYTGRNEYCIYNMDHCHRRDSLDLFTESNSQHAPFNST